ncbi:carboxymuconolactone decarboxylase family protein [Alkaliphilus peptidifermentans]|uniref:Alkylhydroperoxidase AhpD family core domain-containing protein n=1 Tax=Alkaliphilus peptidifermentans DSM 18978 TaxID=1120976 RepID=A0A1G5EKP0_9FIRM|nr:carboxymuconolactone decarboxylase family protein [Alkaliphilus peptidifermentans]SCY27514.1 alkylhydroperoxidase AhpD family core domain-containing protein [Alkaliphilus peptidifermentans DSM 18978]
MAKITPLETSEVDQQAKKIFDEFMEQRGNIPNMFKTLAYRPQLLETAHAHFKAILFTGTVDIKLKEMLAVRVSVMNECAY